MKLSSVGYFNAGPRSTISPNTISPDTIYVEVIVDGCVDFEINGRLSECRYGSVFWHKPGDHTIFLNHTDDPYICYTFTFSSPSLSAFKVPRYFFWGDGVVEFAKEAAQAFHREAVDNALLTSYVFSTLSWKASQYSRQAAEHGLPVRLRELMDAVDDNPGGDYSLEGMSEISGYSIPHIHTLFSRYFQTSPHQYVRKKRVGLAKYLLAGDRIPIKQIAGRCGYKNPESFNRFFKEESGRTPGEYRRIYSRPVI